MQLDLVALWNDPGKPSGRARHLHRVCAHRQKRRDLVLALVDEPVGPAQVPGDDDGRDDLAASDPDLPQQRRTDLSGLVAVLHGHRRGTSTRLIDEGRGVDDDAVDPVALKPRRDHMRNT
jgi:hypothetical protein